MSADPDLLDRALAYALEVVPDATPDLWARPTPCRDWDLRTLLRHVDESLAALSEGIGTGRLCLDAPPEDESPESRSPDPATTVRERADRLRADWSTWSGPRGTAAWVVVEGRPLPVELAAGVGALEVAVHAWDVSQGCGRGRAIPTDLAADLLRIAPLLVTDDLRGPLFAPAMPVASTAGPCERLVAYLGRDVRARACA